MDKTITYNGHEYHIIDQFGVHVNATIAYRYYGSGHVEVLRIYEYKSTGNIEYETQLIHLGYMEDIVSHMKSMNEIEGKEGQKELNHELERVVGI